MLLQRNQPFFRHYSAKAVRDLLRKVGELFSLSQFGDDALAEFLVSEGYIERDSDSRSKCYYRVSARGGRLRAARVGRPLGRSKAKEVLARAATINAEAGPTRVERILVFGSFLDDGIEELGDLDLAVDVRINESAFDMWYRDQWAEADRTKRRLKKPFALHQRIRHLEGREFLHTAPPSLPLRWSALRTTAPS